MNDSQMLRLVRVFHAAVYAVVVVSTGILLYAGITGRYGVWLWVALALVALEVCVYVGSGMKCPVTGWAVRYGAPQGHAFDLHLSARQSDYLLNIVTGFMVLGLVILGARGLGILRWTP
jgi:hypothetical protein